MSSNKSQIELKRGGRTLSYILRHGIIVRSITVHEGGYVKLDDILKQRDMRNFTVDDIKQIVDTNDKQRFVLKEVDGSIYIRANQGHSKDVGSLIDDDTLLIRVEKPYPICVHGTTVHAWDIIKNEGLMPMGRKHIHLASGLPGDDDVISGMRKSSRVIVYVDMQKAMDRGKTFFVSKNGVILTPDTLEPDLLRAEYK